MEFGLVVRWLVAYLALGALGYPVAARLFRRFPDRGAGLALPVALVGSTTVVFWLGHLAYGPLTVAVGVLALAGAATLAGLDLQALRRRRLVRHPALSVDRDAVAPVVAVFVGAFLFLVAVRALDPAVHAGGGEKFLDFGLLRSLLRSGALPPEDAWFAGRGVRYYYGGHLMAATLTYVTATAPRFGYNLALAGFYATLVTAAYSLAAAVAADRGRSHRTAGAFAAFFVGVAANLQTAARLVGGVLPDGLLAALAPGDGAAGWAYAPGELVGEFSYWDASRVIPGTINEFPLFAWLNGDLHAHMMGTPFLLLAAAIGFALYRTPAGERRRRRLLLFVAVPIVGGVQAAVDTWSFPSVFGVTWLALTLAPASPWALAPRRLRAAVERVVRGDPVRSELARPIVAAALVAVAGGVALALAAPFLLTAILGGGSERSLAVLAASDRSTLAGIALVHGAFLALFWAYGAARLRRGRGAVAVGVAALAVAAIAVDAPVLALVGPVLIGAWALGRLDDGAGYEAILIAGGAGLVVLVELLFLNEQAGPGRMNTVFKTYTQVWVLWGTAAGIAVAALAPPSGVGSAIGARIERPLGGSARADGGVADAQTVPDPEPTATAPATDRSRRALAADLLVAALVVSTSVYGALALAEHVAAGRSEPTLSATAFAAENHPDEGAAIAALDDAAGPGDVLLSAPGTARYPTAERGDYPYPPGMYSWGANPAASLTGVPTVAGWGHEVGYRGPEAYFERVDDVDRAYTSRSAAVDVLRRYDVTYVYVGPTERDRYGAELIRFDGVDGVEPAFEHGGVTVYRVDAEELPSDGG